jgi:hypothetical protein
VIVAKIFRRQLQRRGGHQDPGDVPLLLGMLEDSAGGQGRGNIYTYMHTGLYIWICICICTKLFLKVFPLYTV